MECRNILLEVTSPGAEVFARSECFEGTGTALTPFVRDFVAPPLKLNICPLESEEDDDASDGDAAGPRSRENKVVLYLSVRGVS